MYLVQILLPVQDGAGRPFDRDLFDGVRVELTELYGGLTAYTRSPAEGLWKSDRGRTEKDEIVVYEIMCDTLDRSWWSDYRRKLERRFQQEVVVMRASEFEQL